MSATTEALRGETAPGGVAEEIRAAAEGYCRALHRGDAEALRALFAPTANLYAADGGAAVALSRDAWLERVAGRGAPAEGTPADFAIELVDVAGPDTALARVSVQVGPRRFRDYLNFLKVGGSWQVIAKVYRLLDGPAA